MRYRLLLAAMIAAMGLLGARGVETVDPESFLTTLRAGHPRLMLTDERLAELRVEVENDETLLGYAMQVKEQADAALELAPLEHKLVGPRLLSVSRECLKRMYTLALAWRWMGEEKYAQAAEANLLTVCAFPDWNPSHFLDTAEMSHAVAIGYDWLYGHLSDENKATIKTALIEKGLKPGIAVYETGKKWTISDFNWNQVCNGGMMIGALAIAETDPDYARTIVPKAVKSLPLVLRSYDPDGAWMEGPGYWHYATRYTAYALSALDTALGTDFGLSDSPGLRITGHFPTYTTGPTGLVLNYADSGERTTREPMPCMFWLARKYNDAIIANAEHAVLRDATASPLHVVWYVPRSDASEVRDLDRHFRGPVDIVVMRSAWDDPNALFVGVKGGYNQVNHGHLDLGNFELDALGVRWARDLGSDDYNLPGYWDKKAGGERWKYYRLNSASHNIPTINGHDQDAEAVAKVLEFVSQPDGAHVAFDLTSTYPGLTTRVTRDVALVDKRRAVVVRDTFETPAPCDIAWAMTTDAAIEAAGHSATLTLDGKQLVATILAPPNASFMVESAERPAPERRNEGVQRLVARIQTGTGSTSVTVLLAPARPDGAVTAAGDVQLP
jgi:hypothetical protein